MDMSGYIMFGYVDILQGMTNINSATLMMVTYNRLELTKKTLDNLSQVTNYPHRLIIIDNGSTDGTIEWLRTIKYNNSSCIGLDVEFNQNNLGIAHGRNQGLKISDRYNDPWLVTIDNDIELYDGWLNECVGFMEINPKYSIGINFEPNDYPILNKNGKLFQYKQHGNIGTACAAFSRQLHNVLGFFSMEYGNYGEEDADYFMRSRYVGYELGYLVKRGVHLGEGAADIGEYREFKTKSHADNLEKFRSNCRAYVVGTKSLYIPFK